MAKCCKKCGTFVEKNAEFCSECGSKIKKFPFGLVVAITALTIFRWVLNAVDFNGMWLFVSLGALGIALLATVILLLRRKKCKKWVIRGLISLLCVIVAFVSFGIAASEKLSPEECAERGHRWISATCIAPQKCLSCGTSEGDALGHEWIEATCEQAQTCTRCSEEDGTPLGHYFEEYTTTKEATCTSQGELTAYCTRCDHKITQATKQWSPRNLYH